MIVFVGDQPSKKNIDPNIPFVGTQSYKRLLEWIWEMDVNVNNVCLKNQSDLKVNLCDCVPSFCYKGSTWMSFRGCKFITLGKNAYRKLNNLGIDIDVFELPHPSGRNLKLNDKKWLKQQLKECKKWLNS